MSYKYYRVKGKYQGYRGERYFRFDPMEDHATQVLVNQGQIKKGRAHTYGVYMISRGTFLTNYLGMGYVEVIPKSEFKKWFKIIVKTMKP